MYQLQLNYTLKGNLQKIYPAVLDMRQFGKHHPYMKEVKLVQTTNAYTEYNIKKFVWIFGFIPQWPNYNAQVFEIEKNKHIQYKSAVKGGLELHIDFIFANNPNDTTSIVENITLTGGKMVCKILLSTIEKSHAILVKNIEKTA